MHGQTNDLYMELLAQWQARREVVNVYHRAIRFLAPLSGAAPQRRRELIEKLANALIALRQASDQLQRYEQERAIPDPQ
jgi:DNA-dependent RNA polymerase auxiliary subunit epsilon